MKSPRFLALLLLSLNTSLMAQNRSGLRRWEQQTSGTTASLRGLFVVDDNTVWASGAQGTLLKTSNGGRRWEAAVVPDSAELDFRDVQSLRDRTLLLINAGMPAKIFRSGNDGLTWETVYNNRSPAAFFDGLAFWDERHGVAFSDPVDGRLLVLLTSDGGKTWQAVKNNLPAALQGEAGFAASGTSVAVAGRSHAWIGLGGKTTAAGARVLLTTDRGKTWQVSETPMPSSSSAGIFSIAFSDARNGVAVGGDYKQPDRTTGNAMRTQDGGKTWRLISKRPPSGFRSAVAAAPGKKGLFITVGTNGADVSLDGGKTWQTFAGRAAKQLGFHAVACSEHYVYVCGADGRIARWKYK